MKKVITIILTIFLVLSVVGNVYLFVEWQSAKRTLLSEQNAINTTLTEKDSILSEANKKVTELETTISDLQNQIGELETKLDTTTTLGGFIVEIIEPKTMYVIKDCNIHKGPDAETYERAGTLNQAQEVKVTGKVNEANWYEISLSDGTTAYVSGTLISEKPQPTKTDKNGAPINPETGQPYKPGDVIGVTEYNDGGTATFTYLGPI